MSWKIYGLKLKGDDKIRYIGQTIQKLNARFANHKSDFRLKTHKVNWMKKNIDNVEIVLIEDNISSIKDANIREIYWIKYYNDKGNRLVNTTLGGDGRLGHQQTVYQKKVCSDRMKKNNPMFDESVRKMVSATKSGVKLSKEHREKISNSSRDKGVKAIAQLSLEGDIIKKWISITRASKELGYDLSSIAKCCRGKQKTAYNYKWKWIL